MLHVSLNLNLHLKLSSTFNLNAFKLAIFALIVNCFISVSDVAASFYSYFNQENDFDSNSHLAG